LAIVLSVLLQFTDSDYPFGIFKFFLRKEPQEAISVYLFFISSSLGVHSWTSVSNKSLKIPKGVIRSRKSRKVRQYNGTKNKEKRTNNDLQEALASVVMLSLIRFCVKSAT
jgi:hypothetical protein